MLMLLRLASLLLLLLFNTVSGEISLHARPESTFASATQHDLKQPLGLKETSSSSKIDKDENAKIVDNTRHELEFDGTEIDQTARIEMNDNGKKISGRAASLKCGRSFQRYGGHKIVGGRQALVGEYPWQVSLQTAKFSGRLSHYCGAAVIDNEWIITASHCVQDFDPSDIVAVVGAYDLRLASPGMVHRTGIRKIISRPDFVSTGNLRNDLALLKVAIPFDLSTRSLLPINSACLPERNSEYYGTASVSGWGKVSEAGDLANILRAVNVTIMTDGECRAYYGPQRIESTMTCAGFDRGGRDACQGDSGGPMVVHVGGGQAVLVGVVSWGIGCARAHNPGVYTQVSKYVDWIFDVMSRY